MIKKIKQWFENRKAKGMRKYLLTPETQIKYILDDNLNMIPLYCSIRLRNPEEWAKLSRFKESVEIILKKLDERESNK